MFQTIGALLIRVSTTHGSSQRGMLKNQKSPTTGLSRTWVVLYVKSNMSHDHDNRSKMFAVIFPMLLLHKS